MMLRPAPLFADHMVLPRGSSVPVFGLGIPGKTVEVQFGTFRSQSLVQPEGTWKVVLPPQAPGGPFTMKIKSAGQVTTISDILVGDVWLCSGQSNMEWPVSRCKEVDEMKTKVDSEIRQFRVVRQSVEAPLREVRGNWVVGSPSSIGNWSAIGLAFAIEVHQKIKIPIGLIQATWGGTRIEAWMSQRSLESDPRLKPLIDEYYANLTGFQSRLNQWQSAADAWDAKNEKKDPGNAGFDKGWHRPEFNDKDWADISLPEPWEQDETKDVDGASWYRFHFRLPRDWEGKGLRLELGFIGNDDSTYVNGLKVGGTFGKLKGRSYYLGPGVMREGENVIAVRVWNRSGEGGILGPNLKLGPTDGGAYMDLATTWKTKNELVIEPSDDPANKRPIRPMGPGDRNAPAGAFDGMIAPIIPYGIKGVLWYQGENNVGQPDAYRTAFPTLIDDWRARWSKPNLPFFFVQLPGYSRAGEPDKKQWAELRDAQLSGLNLPYVRMVVSIDQVDPDTIHPIKKYEIGRRLANLALAQVYGSGAYAFSPIIGSVKLNGNSARLIFENAYRGLKSADGNPIQGFEVLGDDGEWHAATAEIMSPAVVVKAMGIDDIKGVRYCWSDDPRGNLANSAGLPAVPFTRQGS
ncbi:MAG: beta galactosidase jelly roll domain-containing protein [Armatimonadetes bacterium]|nr:beta galactosidase jelly roll domain-containing protein [Armatimonadota bacterium]